ncbi:MAG: hypothetical protein ACRD3W_19145 [Terriglobales bacterium]
MPNWRWKSRCACSNNKDGEENLRRLDITILLCSLRFSADSDYLPLLGMGAASLSAFASGSGCFFARKFVRGALFMSRLSAFAGDFTLLGYVHRSKSSVASAVRFVIQHMRLPLLKFKTYIKDLVWLTRGGVALQMVLTRKSDIYWPRIV